MADHHTAYLSQTLAALTPEGHERVDELLDQLAGVVGGRERLARFAAARRVEADLGRVDASPDTELSRDELEALASGFLTIRDQEPRDDVAAWANAVLALLRDEAARSQ